jgi:hypothetical protein
MLVQGHTEAAELFRVPVPEIMRPKIMRLRAGKGGQGQTPGLPLRALDQLLKLCFAEHLNAQLLSFR